MNLLHLKGETIINNMFNNCLVLLRLALNTMTLQVSSVNVNSGQGVSISVTGIAQVRIARDIARKKPRKFHHKPEINNL